MLLAFGAEINPVNHEKITPLDICARKSASMEHSKLSPVEIIPTQSANTVEPDEELTTQYLNKAGVLLHECGAVFRRNLINSHSRLDGFVEMTLIHEEKKEESAHYSKVMASGENWCKKLSKKYCELDTHVASLLKDVSSSLVSDKEELDKAASLGLQMREIKLLQLAGSRILFLDGGGMKGLLEIEMLSQIEKRTGRRIVELFDWIVGTSTGAIIALGLVYGNYQE